MPDTPDTLLMVEDDRSQARLIGALIQGLGLKVLHFASAESLFEELPKLPPSRIALIDLALPNANGIEVMRRLLLHPTWARVPAVVLTACDPNEWMPEAKRLRVEPEAFLAKPVSAKTLQATIRHVLERDTPLLRLREAERRRVSVENEHRRSEELKERQLGQIAAALRETDGLLERCRSTMAGQRQRETAARSVPKLKREIDDRKRIISEAIVFNEGTLDALRTRRDEIIEAHHETERRFAAELREAEAKVVLARHRWEAASRAGDATGTDG